MSPAFLGCQNALYSVPRLDKEGENFLLNLHPQALEQIILEFHLYKNFSESWKLNCILVKGLIRISKTCKYEEMPNCTEL